MKQPYLKGFQFQLHHTLLSDFGSLLSLRPSNAQTYSHLAYIFSILIAFDLKQPHS